MKIKLRKIEELKDAIHPENISIGFEKEGEMFCEPKVGECFWVGNLRTSIVKEIIDPDTFKTCNSIYKIERLDV